MTSRHSDQHRQHVDKATTSLARMEAIMAKSIAATRKFLPSWERGPAVPHRSVDEVSATNTRSKTTTTTKTRRSHQTLKSKTEWTPLLAGHKLSGRSHTQPTKARDDRHGSRAFDDGKNNYVSHNKDIRDSHGLVRTALSSTPSSVAVLIVDSHGKSGKATSSHATTMTHKKKSSEKKSKKEKKHKESSKKSKKSKTSQPTIIVNNNNDNKTRTDVTSNSCDNFKMPITVTFCSRDQFIDREEQFPDDESLTNGDVFGIGSDKAKESPKGVPAFAISQIFEDSLTAFENIDFNNEMNKNVGGDKKLLGDKDGHAFGWLQEKDVHVDDGFCDFGHQFDHDDDDDDDGVMDNVNVFVGTFEKMQQYDIPDTTETTFDETSLGSFHESMEEVVKIVENSVPSESKQKGEPVRILVLISKQGTGRQMSKIQSRALVVLDYVGVDYFTLDGSDPEFRATRDELVELSERPWEYPQFFHTQGDEVFFLGGMKEFNEAVDKGCLGEWLAGL